MKITKSQLKKLIKEELNELTSDDIAQRPAPSGTDQGIDVVRRHLGEIVAELMESDLSPHHGPTTHTGFTPDLDAMAVEVYKMIMTEMGAA